MQKKYQQALPGTNKKKYFLFFGIFVLGVGITIFCGYLLYGVTPFAPKAEYSLLNPSVSLFDKKDLIVNFEELRKSLNKKYERRDDYLVSLYFEYLPTGANINVNRDERIWPASLIKIPVAMTAMQKVNEGHWKLSNELVLLDEDKDMEYGVLYQKPSGTTFSIQTLLEESLINSDNTAHFILLRNIESSELEETYKHLGMDDIIDDLKKKPKDQETDNRMTAKRYTIFFRSLYNSTFLSSEYSQLFLSILEKAPKQYLSDGLPQGISFVHKTGVRVDEHVWADSGIIYAPNRPYLLTVMIQKKRALPYEKIDPKTEEDVQKLFKDISEEVYTYVSKAN